MIPRVRRRGGRSATHVACALAALVATFALAPFGGSAFAGGTLEEVSASASSCALGFYASAPNYYSFEVANRAGQSLSAALVDADTGIAIAELHDVAPGSAGSVSAWLVAGTSYEWTCLVGDSAAQLSSIVTVPGPGTTTSPGTPVPATLIPIALDGELRSYQSYANQLLGVLSGQLATLRARLAAHDATGARSAFIAARTTWLELGQDDGAYGAFGELGGEIDGGAGGVVGGTSSRGFTGLHRVEFDLFTRRNLAAAGHDVSTLIGLVGQLTPSTVAADLPIANGLGAVPVSTVTADAGWVLRCHEILEDAERDTLTGDDDYGSHMALDAIAADVIATREMLTLLAPLIERQDPSLVGTASAELSAVDAAVAAAHPSERLPLTALSTRLRQQLDGAVGAAVETLAPVSELIQVGDS
jgi:high-affinity iron transporter